MKDLVGQAMLDYYHRRQHNYKLWVAYPDGSKDKMPVATYFRTWKEMPFLEQIALKECRGRVLDIGAGAGSHTIHLQEEGLDVTALDYSPGAIEVAQLRGVRQAHRQDFFDFQGKGFDTLLLLMNGIGLTGNIAGLKKFLSRAASLLNEGGQLLFDSSDLAYLYEDGLAKPTHYYGEVTCRYVYKRQKSDWFNWLYVDQKTLQHIAESTGWQMTLLFEDEQEQYLVKLTRR